MKKLALACAVFACAAPAFAELEGLAPSFSIDYFGEGNLSKHANAATNRQCTALLAAGAASCNASSATGGALGGRVGLMYRTPDFWFGPSIGAYHGGPTAGKTSILITPAGAANSATQNATYRFVLEDWKRFQLDEDRTILLGASAGAAVVRESSTCVASGAMNGVCGPGRVIARGFYTWEVGPALLLHGVEIAVRWVAFVRHGFFPWNTYSTSLGYRF